MRLIGIQALLTLLPHRIEAEAHAFGFGDDVAVSNAGVLAHAAGIGTANGNLTFFLGSQAISQGHGFANGAGALTGAAAAVGASAGIGAGTAIKGADPVGDFLIRTSGLDSTHMTAYTNLINGLDSDGVWPKLDVLYIFATQNTTTALLNLVSSNFSGTVHGSPGFTADRGYTGVDASTTIWIDSGFNATTATSPKFTANSCHVSAWADTNVISSASGGVFIGTGSTGAPQTNILGRLNDGLSYFRINDNPLSSGVTNASASSIGHWVASRTGASASAGYKNGSLVSTINQTAGVLQNTKMAVLAYQATTGIFSGTAAQITMASIGGSLTATDVTNFYNRLRTYMTAVGVP